MSEPLRVAEQITDSVTQSNVKVVAEAPAMAMGVVYQALAHSTGMMFENSVNSQQQQNMLQQAATTQGVIQMYSVDTLSDAAAASSIIEGIVDVLQVNSPGG